MGFKFSEIEEQQRIILHIHTDDKQLDLEAVIQKHIKDNLAAISINFSGTQQLVFDNVQIDVEYCPDNDIPSIWHNAKIASYKGSYVMQLASDGVRNNRRNSFRVSVAKMAWFKMAGKSTQQVMVKDISLSGFSISDHTKELNLAIGDQLSISFEDWGHQIDLDGRVVRIEEREDMIIYGMAICNMCKDLSAYVNNKQRRNRKQV